MEQREKSLDGARVLVWLVLGVFAVVFVRTAWHCDDAYVTYRTVDNFVNGEGLRWNTFERVQAYTHPLWMFTLSAAYFVTREIHVTALVVSMIVALFAVRTLLRRTARSVEGAVLAIAALLGSNAFLEYSTGGLENPLTCLLIALFAARFFQTEDTPRRVFLLALIACLGVLNRMDTLLLFAPALGWRLWRARSIGSIIAMGVAFLPFVAWEAFSLVYYGFLTPNTAFAKLNTGVSQESMWRQGFWYLASTFRVDAATFGAIAVGLLVPIFTRDRAAAALALGIGLYLVYIARIGGDFMVGRFLCAPVFVAAILIARARWRPEAAVGTFGALAVLFAAVPYPAAFQGEDFGKDRWNMKEKTAHAPFIDYGYVKDQRGLSYPHAGLLPMRHHGWEPDHPWVSAGRKYRKQGAITRVNGAIGMRSFYAGPKVRIIDYYALSDPLLARLPTRTPERWLIGHFDRILPDGYRDSVDTGKNVITDPGVAAYYDKLKLITQGPLWDPERWEAIVDMNLGRYEHLLDDYKAQVNPGPATRDDNA